MKTQIIKFCKFRLVTKHISYKIQRRSKITTERVPNIIYFDIYTWNSIGIPRLRGLSKFDRGLSKFERKRRHSKFERDQP